MFVLFEDAGKFQAGRILSEAESSAQVELDSGKRVKVKAAHLLLRFEKPAPAQFLEAARSVGEGIELDLAWEILPDEEFGFADLAHEYFSAAAGVEQQAGALLRLHEAPHYFRRAGKGRFRKAPAEVIQQALAAIEKKKLVQAQIAEWAQALARGECPAPIREQLYRVLFRPDKNAPEYKAVVEAARATHKPPLQLLREAHAIESAYEFHWRRFLFDNFPKGTGFPPASVPAAPAELPLAPVEAFSIDDSATTEIDDALSVQGLGTGQVTVGIHIAAPGLALAPDSVLDQVARARLSTVYMPGYKITMLPDEVVQAYTLAAGRDCPAVSLYVTLDGQSLAVQHSETRVERVRVSANLRHDRLDALVTEAWLEDAQVPLGEGHGIDAAQRARMGFLYRLAKHLKAAREQVRGKPELFNRPDYQFRLVGNDGREPDGSEQVQIETRRRGAPLDLIVAEAMILANSTWGSWLAELGVPAIYRSQASLAPGIKVRMGTKAAPHAGIGVRSYAWSTSPLRRYVDLVNQWQIIAAARHGRTAALAAPFKPKDAALFAVISAFDAAYTAYNGYQAAMERFWTLQYLRQNGITELVVSLLRDDLVRAEELPLVFPVAGTRGMPRGARLRVRLGAVDDIALDVSGTLVERLDEEGAARDAAAAQEEEEEEGEDAEVVAGPIAIAVDVNEADDADGPRAPAPDNPAS